ncbi:MAG: DUF4203 domain-containing protein [Verrucomicrobiota bacterium]|jgi:hypothetical protein
MNANAWVGEISAPLAIAAGLLIGFLGYRLLKLTLGIMGFIAGASGGWAVGLSLEPGNSGIALVCAVIGAAIGAVLYIWLFYLGIFLLGASAGAVVAAALFNAAGNQPQPIALLAIGIVFGLLALVMRKFMIIVSTAFSGSYLVMAGLFHLVAGPQNHSPLWFNHAQPGSPGSWGYVALAFWLILGLAGVSFQNRAHRTKAQTARDKAGPV